jgi:ATP-dependent DNA helicase RecG
MKTAAELLAELNELDEHITIDAKTAADLGKSMLETACAYANEPNLGGGYILLGVAPANNSLWPTYEVVGVDDPDKLQNDIASQCATMFNVPVRPRMVPEKIGGKPVITVFVPEAGLHEKPVHFKNQPLPGSAFRRIGSTDQRCTDDDLVIFYQDRRGETFDEQIVGDAQMSDFDPDAIEQYRQLRREVNPEAEELRWSNQELLEALGAVRKQQDQFKPTVAGLLLFGTAKAQRQFFPMMRIDYIRVPGVQWVKDPDRRFDTVEIRSPLI